MTEISNNSVPLARDQNDNGSLSAVASNGTDDRHRLKKGDVRDGRIFLGSREEEEERVRQPRQGKYDAQWDARRDVGSGSCTVLGTTNIRNRPR